MAQLALGQTLVSTVSTCARMVKICPTGENSGCGKHLILQFYPMCKKILLHKVKIYSCGEKITISVLPMGNITY